MGRLYAGSVDSIFLYGIKCLGVIYEQQCCLKIFWTFSFNSTDCQNLWCCGSISLKAILIFPGNLSISSWIRLRNRTFSCYNSKSYVFSNSEIAFLEERMKPLVGFSIVFCLYIALHNGKSMSSNFLTIFDRGLQLFWGGDEVFVCLLCFVLGFVLFLFFVGFFFLSFKKFFFFSFLRYCIKFFLYKLS